MKKLLFILLLLPVLAQAYPGLPNPPRPANTSMQQNPPPYFLYDGYGNLIGSTSLSGVDMYFGQGGVSGPASVNITTGATPDIESPVSMDIYTINMGGATAYNLPTASVGSQRCYINGVGIGGILMVATSATGQFIDQAGVNSASGGYIVSGGALGDMACFVGISATQWVSMGTVGTWTLH
jgi:hypothetical protein